MAVHAFPEAFTGLLEPARYKAYYGGRASAKSHSCATVLVSKGIERPLRWLFCREIQKSLATSVHQLLRDQIAKYGMNDFYTIGRDGIHGANGTHFLFAGLRTNPDSIKSMEGLDGAWIEEAQTVSQLSLDLLIPTLRKPGSEAWFTWNRRSVNDPVDKMFLGGPPPPNSIVKKVDWRDNPFFPEVLRSEMEFMKLRDPDKWRHIWEGEPLRLSDALVFRNWREDDLDDDIPADARRRFGADWGFSIDPTVAIEVYTWGRVLYIANEVYKVGCEIDETPSFLAGSDIYNPPRWNNRHMHAGIDGIERGPLIADGSRPETISYLKKRGFNITKAVKGARSVEEGVEFIKSFDIIVNPRCKRTIDELRTYSYEIDKLTDEIIPKLKDKDNHVIDALRYAVEAERRAKIKRGIATFASTVKLRG